MARFSSFQIVLMLVASFVAFQFVTSQELDEVDEGMKEYCKQKNDTLDIAMTVFFSCRINATTEEWMKKNKECFEKVNPNGVPFPKDGKNKEEVKKFACQKNFDTIAKKANECTNQPEKEMKEEEKRIDECLSNYYESGS